MTFKSLSGRMPHLSPSTVDLFCLFVPHWLEQQFHSLPYTSYSIHSLLNLLCPSTPGRWRTSFSELRTVSFSPFWFIAIDNKSPYCYLNHLLELRLHCDQVFNWLFRIIFHLWTICGVRDWKESRELVRVGSGIILASGKDKNLDTWGEKNLKLIDRSTFVHLPPYSMRVLQVVELDRGKLVKLPYPWSPESNSQVQPNEMEI